MEKLSRFRVLILYAQKLKELCIPWSRCDPWSRSWSRGGGYLERPPGGVMRFNAEKNKKDLTLPLNRDNIKT